MQTFAETARRNHARTLAVFGDSITEGAGASSTDRSWASLLALTLGARLINRGIGGTVMQSTPIHDGRQGNGVSRFDQDLLGEDRADCIAIFYGYNDARYTADPANFNVASFERAYRIVLDGLLDAGFTHEQLCVGSPSYPPNAALERGGPGFTGQSRLGFERFVYVVRRLADDYGLFYAPVYEAMARETGSSLASEDWVHPNDDGHGVIARAFATATKT
jgi:lysophospholipase L1-like esterase